MNVAGWGNLRLRIKKDLTAGFFPLMQKGLYIYLEATYGCQA
jgi:hypothetical protein